MVECMATRADAPRGLPAVGTVSLSRKGSHLANPLRIGGALFGWVAHSLLDVVHEIFCLLAV